jgi:hypothetical protein
MEVDHVIPQDLLDDPAEFDRIKAFLGLPAHFEINGYGNWRPCCGPCNKRKRAFVYEQSGWYTMVLAETARKADEAERLETKILTDRSIANAVGVLRRAKAKGGLKPRIVEQLRPLLVFQIANRAPELDKSPIYLASGLEVISDAHGIITAKGAYGIGGAPSMPRPHSSFDCPNCGPTAWNGARCVRCGALSDD